MPRPRTRKTKVEKKKVEAYEAEEAEKQVPNVSSNEDSFRSEEESENASQEDSVMEEAETDPKVEAVESEISEEIINEEAGDNSRMETDNTTEDKLKEKGEEEIKQENFDKDMNDESQGFSEKDTNTEEIVKKEKEAEEEKVVRYKPQAFPSFGNLSILEKWQWHFKIFPIDQADMRSCILDSVSKIAQETWMYIDKQNYGMGTVELCMKNSVDASTVLLKTLTMPLTYRYLTVKVSHRRHNLADVENLKASLKDMETTEGEEEEDDIEEKIEKLPYSEVEETATVLLDNVYTLSMEKIKGKEKNRSLYVKYLPEGTTKELLKVLFPVANNLDILTTRRGRRVGVLNVASASNVPGMCSAYVSCHINGCKTVALDWKEENLDDGIMNEEAVEELPWDVIPRNLEYPYETALAMEADEKTKYGKHRRLADGVVGRRRSDGEGGRGRRGDWMGEDPQVESMLRMQQEMNMRIQSQLALIQSASGPPPMGDFPPPPPLPPPPRFLDSPPFRGPPGPMPLMRAEPPRDFRDLKQERRGRPLQRDRMNPEGNRHSDDRRASRDRSESKKAEPEGGKKERGPRVSRWDTEGDSQPKRGLLDRPTSRDSDSKRFDDKRRGLDGGKEFGFDNRGRGDMYDDGPPRGRFVGDRSGRFGGDRGGRFGGDRGGRFGDRGGRFGGDRGGRGGDRGGRGGDRGGRGGDWGGRGGDRGGRGGDRDMPFSVDNRGDRFSGNRGGRFGDHGGPFEGGNQGGRFGDRGGEFSGRFGAERGGHFSGGDRFGGNRFENRGRGGRFGDRGGSAFGNRGGFGNSGRPSGNQEQQNNSRGRGGFQNRAENRGGFNANQRGGFGKQGQHTEKGSNKGNLGNQQSMGGNQSNFGNRESYTKQQPSVGSRQGFGNQDSMGNQQSYQQQGNYGNQPSMYGSQQNNYGNQQNNYGNQQTNYGNQQNNYGNQQNSYGNQQNSFGNQQNYGNQQDNYGNQQNYLTQQSSYDNQQGNFNNQQSSYGSQQQNFNNLQNNLTNQGGYGIQQNSLNQYTNQQQNSGQQGGHTGSATQAYTAAPSSGSEGFWGQGMDYSQYTSQGYSTGQVDMNQSTYSTQDSASQQNWQTGQVQGTDYGVSSQNYTPQNYSTQQTTNQIGMGSTNQSAMGSGISADATFANQGFYGTTQTQDATSTYGAYSTSDSTGYSAGNQGASQGQQQYNMTTAYNFAQYPSTS